MHRLRLLVFSGLCLALPVLAQTYTPKAIRLEGADGVDQTQLLHLIDLPHGAPLTKDQIEAAMQRLMDSGLFSDMSYTVGPEALVFTLKPAEGAQALPVRFGNLVWWQKGELEPLLEARVPLYRGRLPLTGQLTAQVEAALATLLAEKGIANAKLTSQLSTQDAGAGGSGISAIVLRLSEPPITLGHLQLTGIAPSAAETMQAVSAGLSAQEFDSLQTPKAIVLNTEDAHRNAGYLDAAVDSPRFSAPRQQGSGFAVDAAATVHPGPLYRVAAIKFAGVPPGMEANIAKSTELKQGDPAGEMTLRIGEGLAKRTLDGRGLLDASVKAEASKDTNNHAIAYSFLVVPGPVYHVAGIDVSALPSDLQRRLLAQIHASTGAVADAGVVDQIRRAVASSGGRSIVIGNKLDRQAQTVTYVLRLRSGMGAQAGSE